MELITRAKLLEMLDISTSTYDRWIKDGTLPTPIKPGGEGGKVYFKQDEVIEALIKSRSKDSN